MGRGRRCRAGGCSCGGRLDVADVVENDVESVQAAQIAGAGSAVSATAALDKSAGAKTLLSSSTVRVRLVPTIGRPNQ